MNYVERSAKVDSIVNFAINDIFLSLGKDPKIVLNEEDAIKVCSIFKTITNGNKILVSDINKRAVQCTTRTARGLSTTIFAVIANRTLGGCDPETLKEEILNTQVELFKWRESFKGTSSIKSPESISYNEKDLEILKSEVEILKNEMKILKLKIESLNQKNMSKKKTFSASQIKSIKNMSTNGISSRLIAMEFNCEIEDIQNIIDNE